MSSFYIKPCDPQKRAIPVPPLCPFVVPFNRVSISNNRDVGFSQPNHTFEIVCGGVYQCTGQIQLIRPTSYTLTPTTQCRVTLEVQKPNSKEWEPLVTAYQDVADASWSVLPFQYLGYLRREYKLRVLVTTNCSEKGGAVLIGTTEPGKNCSLDLVPVTLFSIVRFPSC